MMEGWKMMHARNQARMMMARRNRNKIGVKKSVG